MLGARRPIIARAQSGLLSITSSALTEPAAVPHWSPSWCRRRDKGEGFGGQIGHAPQQSHDTVWPTAITCFLMLDDKREISNTSMGDFDTATKLRPWLDIDEAVDPKDRVCRQPALRMLYPQTARPPAVTLRWSALLTHSIDR
jgi:hypothetical protein